MGEEVAEGDCGEAVDRLYVTKGARRGYAGREETGEVEMSGRAGAVRRAHDASVLCESKGAGARRQCTVEPSESPLSKTPRDRTRTLAIVPTISVESANL